MRRSEDRPLQLQDTRSFVENGLVDDRRKKDIPEIWGRRGKFDRNQRPFRTILRRTRDLRFDHFLGGHIFDGNLSALRKSFGQNYQRAGGADSMSRAFDGLRLASNFQAYRDAK